MSRLWDPWFIMGWALLGLILISLIGTVVVAVFSWLLAVIRAQRVIEAGQVWECADDLSEITVLPGKWETSVAFTWKRSYSSISSCDTMAEFRRRLIRQRCRLIRVAS